MIASLRHFLGWMVSAFRSREDLVLENLALRQQLLALHAQRPRRRLTALHKLFWVALRMCWSGWRKPLVLITPRTVVNWHREGFVCIGNGSPESDELEDGIVSIQQKLWPSGTFVDFDNGLNTAINRLREALGDSAENPRFVVTEPRRGYRFIAPVNGHLGSKLDSRTLFGSLLVIVSRFKWSVTASVVTVAMLATGGFFYSHRAPKLAGSHSIIVADFSNTTRDPVFDDTLRQGITVQLEQSPFLEIVSDDRIQQTLSLMEQAPNARLTPDLAMQVCQRVGAAAVLDGSVANLGGEYIIGLRARDCQTGKTMGQSQATASEKSKVLGVLGKAGTQIRGRLGETLASIQDYDTPLEDVTTSSLEALQAYSLGVKANRAGDIPPAILFFERAISLDPNFAMVCLAKTS